LRESSKEVRSSAASPFQRFALDAGRRGFIAEPGDLAVTRSCVSLPLRARNRRLRPCGHIGLAAPALLLRDFGRRLSPGDPMLRRSPTLWFRSRGRRPVRLGGALQRGTRVHRSAWIDARADPASPAPPGCSPRRTLSWVSRDRPCGAPLVRFYAPSAYSSHAASFVVGPILPRIGRCRFGVRRPALLVRASAPRAPAAVPSAHAVLRSSGRDETLSWGPRNPRPSSEQVMRRLVRRRRRSATRTELRGPAGTPCVCPGGAHGVRPFAVLLLPARLRGRCPPRRIPLAVSRTVCPDNFRRGISRATQPRSRSCHPRCFGRQPIGDAFAAAPGFMCSSRAIRAVVARVLWRALASGGGRDCLGLCLSQVFGALSRCSDGLDPVPGRQPPEIRFRLLSARGLSLATWLDVLRGLEP
jgi:hypothetical protein